MFALATAIKVFPVAAVPYLVWRRKWTALASMALFLGVFLFAAPVSFRGSESNSAELKTWYRAMVASSSESGFGQRNEQNWSWINQSIIAVTHRLTRPINYNQDDPAKPPRYMNLVDVSFETANGILLAIVFLTGLGFIAVMPSQNRRTPKSDAEELGILFCLMTVATPLARQYYFVWLFLPITVLVQRAAFDRRSMVRIGTSIALAAAGFFMCLSLPVFPKVFQAWGNNLVATAVLAGTLAWHIIDPALPPGTVSSKALNTDPMNG
jgi:hypothetical protein